MVNAEETYEGHLLTVVFFNFNQQRAAGICYINASENCCITSHLFLKKAEGIVLGSVAVSAVPAVSADALPYISVAIKASF